MAVKQEPLPVRTIRISDETVDGLKRRAAKVGQSWTEHLRALAERYLKRQSK